MVRVEMGMFKTKFEFALDINSATTWVATMLCFTPGCLEQTRYIPLPTFYRLPITNKSRSFPNCTKPGAAATHIPLWWCSLPGRNDGYVCVGRNSFFRGLSGAP
jgi:hypothetical protein